MGLVDSVTRARSYLREAIAHAPGYGQGAGPIDHSVSIADRWRAQ
jgi:hydroxymethylpyrimidine/phosphomethylpyrimidine kinase